MESGKVQSNSVVVLMEDGGDIGRYSLQSSVVFLVAQHRAIRGAQSHVYFVENMRSFQVGAAFEWWLNRPQSLGIIHKPVIKGLTVEVELDFICLRSRSILLVFLLVSSKRRAVTESHLTEGTAAPM